MDGLNSSQKVRQIVSHSFYPIITTRHGWSNSLTKTFMLMSREAQRQKLPWFGFYAQGFFYSPWTALRFHNA